MIAFRIVEFNESGTSPQYIAHYCYVVENFQNFRQIVSMTNKYTSKDETVEMTVNGIFYNYSDIESPLPIATYSTTNYNSIRYSDFKDIYEDEKYVFYNFNILRKKHIHIFSYILSLDSSYSLPNESKDYLRLWISDIPVWTELVDEPCIVLCAKMYNNFIINNGEIKLDTSNGYSVVYLHEKVVRIDIINYSIAGDAISIKNVKTKIFNENDNNQKYLHIELINDEIQVNQITKISNYSAQKIENFEDKYTSVGYGNSAIHSNRRNIIISQVNPTKSYSSFFY